MKKKPFPNFAVLKRPKGLYTLENQGYHSEIHNVKISKSQLSQHKKMICMRISICYFKW